MICLTSPYIDQWVSLETKPTFKTVWSSSHLVVVCQPCPSSRRVSPFPVPLRPPRVSMSSLLPYAFIRYLSSQSPTPSGVVEAECSTLFHSYLSPWVTLAVTIHFNHVRHAASAASVPMNWVPLATPWVPRQASRFIRSKPPARCKRPDQYQGGKSMSRSSGKRESHLVFQGFKAGWVLEMRRMFLSCG